MPTAGIQITNRGPLTSIFTPPASCATPTSDNRLYQGHLNGESYDPNCYPQTTGLPPDYAASTPFVLYYYSPGIVCPSGYTTGTTAIGSMVSFTDTTILDPSTTVAICCPWNYSYIQWGLLCGSSVTQGGAVTYQDTLKRVSTTVAASSFDINIDGVPIMWQKRDTIATSTTLEITSLTKATSTTLATTSSSSTLATAAQKGSGLSTSIAIGVGVGSTLGALALLSLVVLWIMRRKKVQKVPGTVHGAVDERPEFVAEVEGMTSFPELLTENVAYHDRHELAGQIDRSHELPGNGRERYDLSDSVSR